MTSTLTNRQIADLLERHGKLLEVSGVSPFRTRAFVRAAEELRTREEPLSIAAREGRLRDIPGVGEGIAQAVTEILASGAFSAHNDLTSRMPESLLELTSIPGIGAKTALKLFEALGIDSLSAVEAALETGAIATTTGLGPRSELTLRDGLDTIRRRSGRTPLGVALPIARAFQRAFQQARPTDTISITGSVRRWSTTVDDLDFLIASASPEETLAAIRALPTVLSMERVGEFDAAATLDSGLRVDIRFAHASHWGSELVRATGNASHVSRLELAEESFATEEELYAARGLPWIPPELRSGGDEFEKPGEIAALITIADVNGEFHAHTTWSDGGASIRDMAQAAAARGYRFLGITDHSHGLGVAGGLSPDRLAAQRSEISGADGLDGVQLLAGAEVEVHRDGTLDFDGDTLSRLDVVVASLHSGLRQPREELTQRLVNVLQNANVDIIAHPSGRLIERREGGDFDWDVVFETAASTGTALEINADPARLDLDPDMARRASTAGCLITVNCDAHHAGGFAVMEYGIAMARRAWLRPDQVLNCWSFEDVKSWLANRGDHP